MYDGTGIANTSSRTTQIGDDSSDTISMPGWYVCNGQSSTPDLRNKFIRSESTSGNTGGEDSHVLTINEMPSHSHGYPAYSSGGAAAKWVRDNVDKAWSTFYTNSTGGDAAHENRPAYYSLIFIKKVS